MPVLVKYEREKLSIAQIYAVRDYIARKRVKHEILNISSENQDSVAAAAVKQKCIRDTTTSSEGSTEDNKGLYTPQPGASTGGSTEVNIGGHYITPRPGELTPAQLRETKQHKLAEISEELKQLELSLDQLKLKKHKLFEEFKILDSLEKAKRKQAEEKERLLHSFPSPFLSHLPGPDSNLVAISPPFKHSLAGNKRPRSPSPPLVQIYSSSTLTQPKYDLATVQSSPVLTHHGIPSYGSLGVDGSKLLFPSTGNRLSGGQHYQQNIPATEDRTQMSKDHLQGQPSSSFNRSQTKRGRARTSDQYFM